MSEHPSFGALPLVLVVSLLLMSEIVGAPGSAPAHAGHPVPYAEKLGPTAAARLSAHLPERFEVDLRRGATSADFAALWSRCVRVVERDYVHRRAWVLAPGHELPHVAALDAVTRISYSVTDPNATEPRDKTPLPARTAGATLRSGAGSGAG